MRYLLISLLWLAASTLYAQTDSIYLHFLYGSKPAAGYRHEEKRVFGGIKGGHVSIELDGKVLDFLPGNNPILPNNSNPTGKFKLNDGLYWDTTGAKRARVSIPITAKQKEQLQHLFSILPQQTPYDYAIFGMRCTAATYEILSLVGLRKPLTRKQNITKNFYPKLFRKRIYKWAKTNGYPIQQYKGNKTRKWESDRGLF